MSIRTPILLATFVACALAHLAARAEDPLAVSFTERFGGSDFAPPVVAVGLRAATPRETAGAVVLPASPGFYHGAGTVADLVDFVVARICDQLGVSNALIRRWGEAT